MNIASKSALIFSALIFSFALNTNAQKKKKLNCKDVMCTEDFRSVAVNIVDVNGNPVALDSAMLFAWDKSVKKLEPGSDNYVIENDGKKKFLRNNKKKYMLWGWKKGIKKVQATFFITADCCHVYKASGPDTITVR